MSDFEDEWAHKKELGRRIFKRLAEDEPAMVDAHMTWKFVHREIDYKVALWGLGSMCDGHGMWNYYLYLREEQFGSEKFAPLWLEPEWKTFGGKREHETYNYYISPFTELDLHGGITLYKRHGDGIHMPRCVEIGCDYGHLWDREDGYGYDLRHVRRDAERSIDLLLGLYPDLRVKCSWDGTYHPREEMLTNKYGRLVWRENRAAIPAGWDWFPETGAALSAPTEKENDNG